MKHEEFAKLPETKIHLLKIKVIGKDPMFFKSKQLNLLNKKLSTFDYYDYEILTFIVKDTMLSDDSHELCGIKSIRGELLE